MKISKETLGILKNFASINSNLTIKPGTKLKTVSAQKNILADVSVAEDFPQEFGIYDLNEFLGALSLFTEPELVFNDKFVTIKENGNQIKYFAADASVLTALPRDISFPTADVEFDLTADQLGMIQKTAAVLRASDVSIVGDGTGLIAVVGDKKNASANTYELKLGATEKTCKVNFKVENLKMIPGDYTVSISSKKISRLKAKTGDLQYFLAVEADSTFA